MGIKIEEIELRNFRIHDNILLQFSDGTNLILGENGTGKTSVFLGIIYALFGTNGLTTYERGKRKENLVRKGSTNGYVKVVINAGNERYIIKRYVPSGDAYVEKLIQGKSVKVCTGSDNVTRFVSEKLFGIRDFPRLINILYVRQRSLGNLILETGKKSFSEKLEEILNIKKFSEIYDYLKSALNILIERLNDAKQEIYLKEKNIQDLLKGSNLEELQKIVEIKEKLQKRLEELKILKARKESIEKFLDENLIYEEERVEEEINEIKRNLSELDKQMDEIRRKVRFIRLIRKDFKEFLDKSINELYKLKEKYEEYKDIKKEEIFSRLKKLEDIYNKLSNYKDKDISKLEDDIVELKNKIEILLRKVGELRTREKILKEIIKIVEESFEPKCPVCGSEIHKKDEILQTKRKELSEIQENLTKIEKEIENIKEIIKEKEEQLNRLKHYMNEAKRILGIEIEDLESLLEFLNNEIESLRKNYEGCVLYEKIVSAISYVQRKEFEDALKNLIEIRKNYENKLETLTKKLVKIKEMKKKKKELEEINKRLKDLGIKDLDEEIKKLEEGIRKYPDIGKDAVKNLKKEIERLEMLKKYKDDLEKYVKILNSILRLLANFKIKLRKEVARKLTEYLNYWFRKIYIYPDIREIKIKVVEGKTDYVYDIYVRRVIGEKEIESPLSEAGLSGGQIVAIDLAMRFALATFLTKKLSFILLDEPTESLDEKIRRKLAEILKSLKDIQIIICTHDEIFKEALSGRGYYFKREGNKIVINQIS